MVSGRVRFSILKADDPGNGELRGENLPVNQSHLEGFTFFNVSVTESSFPQCLQNLASS